MWQKFRRARLIKVILSNGVNEGGHVKQDGKLKNKENQKRYEQQLAKAVNLNQKIRRNHKTKQNKSFRIKPRAHLCFGNIIPAS